MFEAQAQTAEMVGAASEAAQWYTTQAGVAAGTLLIVWVVTLFGLYLLFKRLEKRDQEIAELKVQCAKELASAEVAAAASAEARVQIAWQRVAEIFASTKTLFENVAVSNDKVAGTLKSLELTLATKGITAK